MNPGDLFEHKRRVFTLTNVECDHHGWAYALVAFCLTPSDKDLAADDGLWRNMEVNRAEKPDPVMLTRH